ncbi:probable ribonuclease ZC3H12B isoform X1 [Plutella xylostella]|uniref:probable ribonuclease ZC3H12B isoform X1 n=2 Tax=Plutella xylostella TaxID=51655 RepID=UPI002032E8AC|nr:probable ribonuclease ZC3H12B isoform X1 [Plutella xylostella]
MGKPSRSRLSQPSNHSLLSSKKSLHLDMNPHKKGKKLRKMREKNRKSIQKLVKDLHRKSQGLIHTASDLSASEPTVICLDDTTIAGNETKRKLSDLSIDLPNSAKKSCNRTVIEITDEELVKNHERCSTNFKTPRKGCPISCSTPMSSKKDESLPCNISRLSNEEKGTNNNIDAEKNLQEIQDLTKEINGDSFVTIDLTTETISKTHSTRNTVIDLDDITDNNECTMSVSNTSTMSGDSDVTVLNMSQYKRRQDRKMQKFAKGIAKMNASEKGRLLELITQKIFTGCKAPVSAKDSTLVKEVATRATETAEDTYIREVILGQVQSRNSIGSNIYNPETEIKNKSGLRMIVIDGSNVAMAHGQHRLFSVKGLQICIDYFVRRGHIVKAFVPRFRCKFGKSSEPRVLDSLERRGLVVYTPSREVQGKMITSYDDRYIVQCAAEFDGVIVSGDNYRDLLLENPRWRFVIENRLLQFTWVNDMIMFPKDPLGRNGPTLEVFLKHTGR